MRSCICLNSSNTQATSHLPDQATSRHMAQAISQFHKLPRFRFQKIMQVKSLRLFETLDRLKELGRVEDEGGFVPNIQENKEWQDCW